MPISETIIRSLYRQFEAHPAVSTDSRRIVPGSIFFALRGEAFDGNRFAAEALSKGAVLAVVDDPAVVPDGPEAARFVMVDNVLEALQQLAAHHRRVLGIPILAVTGSNGKTTTKELLAAVLSQKFRISVTAGNLNNHIGVPLTLLAMDAQTQLGIVEMGANAPGEIAALCAIAQPDYGLITNIGRAHLEGFGGIGGVARAKGELFDYLAAHGGLAFVRGDDPALAEMATARPGLRTTDYTAAQGDLPNHLEGGYNGANIAAAAAVGAYFDVPAETVAEAVAGYRPDNHRSQRVETARNVLILDCYNANPSSMAAALDNFAEENTGTETPPAKEVDIKAQRQGLRSRENRGLLSVNEDLSGERNAGFGLLGRLPKVVILGDMLELGVWAAAEHEAVLRRLAEMNLTEAYLVGPLFCAAAARLFGSPDEPKRACCPTARALRGWPAGTALCTFPDREALAAHLVAHPITGRLVLLKGSHGIGLEKIVPAL